MLNIIDCNYLFIYIPHPAGTPFKGGIDLPS
jgi:hypothetical protein